MTKLQKILTWTLLVVCIMIVGLLCYVFFGDGDLLRGDAGPAGDRGNDGKSAYELAVENGFSGSLHEWLVSLAVPGKDGTPGAPGKPGAQGQQGTPGVGVSDVRVDARGHLIVTLTNGSVLDAGYVGGEGFATEEVDDMGFTLTYEQVIMNNEANSLRLRSEPNTGDTSTVLAYLYPGDELLRIGHNKTTGWTRLIYNDPVKGEITGYANAKYFDLKYTYEGDVPEMHLPDSIYLTVGEPFWFITDAILADDKDDFVLSYSYSGKGQRVYDETRAFCLTPAWGADAEASPHADEVETLTVILQRWENGECHEIAKKTVVIIVTDKKPDLQLTGVIIGDSRIAEGSLVKELCSQMPNLTLLGTRTTGTDGVMHEGRGAWSTANFLKTQALTIGGERVENAFYDPDKKGFDFTYYMNTHHPGKTLDFAVINLGANDGFSAVSVDNLAAIVESIRAYDVSVKIIVMTEYLSPDSGYYLTRTTDMDIAQMRAKQFRYFSLLTDVFACRQGENIHLLPNYLCIDEWQDRCRTTVSTPGGSREAITDVIHLGRQGYIKEAHVLQSLLYGVCG